jgi:hypothetical protein
MNSVTHMTTVTNSLRRWCPTSSHFARSSQGRNHPGLDSTNLNRTSILPLRSSPDAQIIQSLSHAPKTVKCPRELKTVVPSHCDVHNRGKGQVVEDLEEIVSTMLVLEDRPKIRKSIGSRHLRRLPGECGLIFSIHGSENR